MEYSNDELILKVNNKAGNDYESKQKQREIVKMKMRDRVKCFDQERDFANVFAEAIDTDVPVF